ncbi:MAG: hypothetical protein PHQ52_04130 [Candidatus Omnitrophica bacterium]|nr:hypothetical protein [Candidatus Omnitrophota bacterium]
MKTYIKPKIKAIELDQRQAVVNVCKADGAYFEGVGATTLCLYNGGGPTMNPMVCDTAGAKRAAIVVLWEVTEQDTMNS